nr:ankyrin repeat domain-containing protein [Flavobacterium selenitireducens]
MNEVDELNLFENDLQNDIFLAEVEKLNDINKKFQKGFNLLHFACEYDCKKLANKLIERNINIEERNIFGNTPLWIAVFNSKGNYDLVDLLLFHNADPNSINKAGNSPLKFAETIGDEILIQKLKNATTTNRR